MGPLCGVGPTRAPEEGKRMLGPCRAKMARSRARRLGVLRACIEPLERRLLLAATPADAAHTVPFDKIVVQQNPGGLPLEKTLADIDGDTKLDLIIGRNDNSGLYWYRYPPSGVETDTWTRFTIVNSGSAYEDMLPYDVN